MSGEPRIPSNARQQSAWRSLTIWAVMVATGVITFQATTTDSLPKAALVAIAITGLVLLFVALVFFNTRLLRRFMTENNAAVGMLARGELQQAREVFWHWAERTQMPVVNAVSRHNLGAVLIRQGKLEQAVEVLTNNEANYARGLKSAAMYPTGIVDLALAHALAGNIDASEQWMKRADELRGERTMPSYPGAKALARAVLDCRAGRSDEAARMLDERWGEYEAVLTGDVARSLRVVRAFAHAAAGPRNAGVAAASLANMRPAYPDEYRYLGVAWPEMQSFLATHQLV